MARPAWSRSFPLRMWQAFPSLRFRSLLARVIPVLPSMKEKPVTLQRSGSHNT